MAPFALAIFSGAFLLFLVQPLIGKYILPWFGGGPGVWTTCMLFFQVLLLGGYAYAYWSRRALRPRTRAVLHSCLLIASLCWLPIIPSATWKPSGQANPVFAIILVLGATLGVPFFVLATTGPLIQDWFSRLHPGRSPYRLYALSNAGSLLALLGYPFLFEPNLTRRVQAYLWGFGLVFYVVSCGICAWLSARATAQSPAVEWTNAPPDGTVPFSHKAFWVLLPACASTLLLAITNKLCQDVAVVPFLWILPLALYLLSFIICFDNPRWYARVPWTIAFIGAMAGLCWALFKGAGAPIRAQIGVYSAGLFVACVVCHGELYRLRPAPERLTTYYLLIAAGGALGGVFVAIGAPFLFTGYYELNWGIALCAGLFVLACVLDKTEKALVWRWLACLMPVLVFAGLDWSIAHLGPTARTPSKGMVVGLRIAVWATFVFLAGSWVARGWFKKFRQWKLLAVMWLGLGFAGLVVALVVQGRHPDDESVYRARNFYGMLTVYEHRREEPENHYRLLQHGRITHGLQLLEPREAAWPTSYYGEESGIGRAMRTVRTPRRVGVVGLGTGTLLSYGREGDYFRIYEINPEVQHVARTWFSYLASCPGKVEIAEGDARLSLERERAQDFDLLALDAFSSDAIPVHLLTAEAFALYGRHLRTNGIMAVHISNHYLDLEPVVRNLAWQFGYGVVLIDFDEIEEEWWLYGSTWMLLSRDPERLKAPLLAHAQAGAAQTNHLSVPLWTDDFTSLYQILK